MPDADGKLRGITVPAEAWERVFGPDMHAHDHDWGQNPPASESILSAPTARRREPVCTCDGGPAMPDCAFHA